MARVGVVDVGTNSTRLLIADVAADGTVTELGRRSNVTRLGQGVDAGGALAGEAMDRVHVVLDEYRAALDEARVQTRVAVLTSAVRDASNGAAFVAEVRERYGLDARVIAGDEEAALTFLGATSERDPAATPGALAVIDIGGGSTELVIGAGRDVTFHVSTQLGVVRQSERHIHSDPPTLEELEALGDDIRGVFAAAVPQDVREGVTSAIAVAGTATSLAAIELELAPYDPARVHGHRLARATCELEFARLAEMTNAERREVVGLHPDRAPTIVAGARLLVEAMRTFGLDEVEVSEHDIVRGAALRAAGAA